MSTTSCWTRLQPRREWMAFLHTDWKEFEGMLRRSLGGCLPLSWCGKEQALPRLWEFSHLQSSNQRVKPKCLLSGVSLSPEPFLSNTRHRNIHKKLACHPPSLSGVRSAWCQGCRREKTVITERLFRTLSKRLLELTQWHVLSHLQVPAAFTSKILRHQLPTLTSGAQQRAEQLW